MNLYELSKSVDLVVHEVIDAEGELSSDLEKRLDEISLAFKEKAGNIGRWVLNIDANTEAINNEMARLSRRAQIQANLKKRLIDYLKFCMENTDLRKIDLSLFTISIVKNPPSVEVSDEKSLPPKYVRVVQTTAIDKQSLLRDIKAGEAVPGAHLITDKTHLRIK